MARELTRLAELIERRASAETFSPKLRELDRHHHHLQQLITLLYYQDGIDKGRQLEQAEAPQVAEADDDLDRPVSAPDEGLVDEAPMAESPATTDMILSVQPMAAETDLKIHMVKSRARPDHNPADIFDLSDVVAQAEEAIDEAEKSIAKHAAKKAAPLMVEIPE
jgi:hypothetical protein